MFAPQKLGESGEGLHYSGSSPSKDLLLLNQRATNSQTATTTTLGMNSNSATQANHNADLFSTKQQMDELNLLRSS